VLSSSGSGTVINYVSGSGSGSTTLFVTQGQILKLIRRPGIDFEESISTAYVAWQAGKSDPVLRIRIRTDPYHFGKQDLDPHLHHSDKPDPEPLQKSRIRIKV
jgi:hypothetical protein